MDGAKKWSEVLRHERDLRGWSQQQLAEELETDEKRVSAWERGANKPGRHYQVKLFQLFDKNAEQLGLLKQHRNSKGPDLPQKDESACEEERVPQQGSSNPNLSQSIQIVALDGTPLVTIQIHPQTSISSSLRFPIGGMIYSDASSETREGFSTKEDTVDKLRRQILEDIVGFLGTAFIVPSLDAPDLQFGKHVSRALLQPSYIDEEVVEKFEKLAKYGWDLLRGNELTTADYLLSKFLPEVSVLAQQPSKYQKRLAGLTAQGYILVGLVAVLQLKFSMSQAYCKQAIEYSRLAQDRNLEVAALKHLATKYMSAKFPLKTLRTYQEALPLVDEVSPLLRARTYLGLAISYAQCKQKQEADRYLGLAFDSFPEFPERDAAFAYADCGIPSLYHYKGLIHLEFEQAKQAWETFTRVEELKSHMTIPDRTIIEIINCQAEAAVAHKDMDLACAHIEVGVEGATRLGSEKRFNDALSIYKQMQMLWPYEQKVKQLDGLFLR